MGCIPGRRGFRTLGGWVDLQHGSLCLQVSGSLCSRPNQFAYARIACERLPEDPGGQRPCPKRLISDVMCTD
jgi:hypothetical protein